MKKVAAAVAATGVALAMGMSAASAAPVFTINPNAIAGNLFATSPFNATVMNGTSSELLHLNATGNTANGWARIDSMANNGNVVLPFVSGLNVDYGLYVNFFLDVSTLSGQNGAPGSKYKINALTFSIWADAGNNNTYTNAQASTNTEATVGNVADDIVLGFGNLVVGTGDLTALGGAALNAVNTFAVCTGAGTASAGGIPVALPCADGTGANYFAAPNPFFQLAFSGFNNATGGVARNTQGTASILDDTVSVQDAVAAITFGNVPEPGSIALLGIALAGLGVSTRRIKSVK